MKKIIIAFNTIKLALSVQLVLSTLILISCTSNSEKNTYCLSGLNSDMIKIIIPKTASGKIDQIYYRIRKLESILGLKSIEEGVDSYEIRFWFSYGHNDTSRLIRILYQNKSWTSEKVSMVDKFTVNDSTYVQFSNSKAIPKSGWKNLFEHICKSNLLELPHYTFFSDYVLFTDNSNIVIIELAGKNFYKMIYYPALEENVNKHNEVQNLYNTLNYINSEMN